MYHYIRDSSAVMPLAHKITLAEFSKHIQLVNPLDSNSINECLIYLEEALINKKRKCIDLKKEESVFTFDDGIRDHFTAAQVLEAEGSSGIFFIASKPYIEGKFLDVHLIHHLVYQENIELVHSSFKKLVYSNLNIASIYENYLKASEGEYNFYGDDAQRNEIKVFMNRFFPENYKTTFLEELLNEINVRPNVNDFYLSRNQLTEMKRMGMIIGGHTHSHRVLSQLTEDEQFDELLCCYKFISDCIGDEPKVFSYPFGRKSSYNLNTLRLLEKSNFKYAFTVDENDLEKSDSIYELSRYDCNVLNLD